MLLALMISCPVKLLSSVVIFNRQIPLIGGLLLTLLIGALHGAPNRKTDTNLLAYT